MNTNRLKTFSQETRVKLINLVETKLNYILESDTAQLRERQDQVDKLKRELESTSKEQLIEKVAYTWFNRFVALRFMDVNGYQPSDVRAITPKEGFTIPELLSDVKEGHYPDDISVNKEHITDLLLNKVPNSDPQNEVYKILLVATCNALNPIFPFLFEKIKDYTELLMPDDLTSDKSILKDIRDNMLEEDCKDVEIIGWLYQFYISEKKDEVFASKSKVKKEDIPAATQLFTPRWIVEYMTQNSVGKLWLKSKPDSDLQRKMKYYIPSGSTNDEDSLKVKSPEELTVIDPACGSGHILVYAFELLTKIYEEEGYKEKEIPQLILTHNLTGIDIDERAAQLASFALMMKAREYNKRFFRNPVVPNITSLIDYNLKENELTEIRNKLNINLSKELIKDLDLMKQATNIGSLITPQSKLEEQHTILDKILGSKELQSDLILSKPTENLIENLTQLILLTKQYISVIANPPYMGGKKMNSELASYAKKNYPDSKSDLFSMFMERGLSIIQDNCYSAMITMESWMFLSSYKDFREIILQETVIDGMIHMPYLGKGGTSMGINFGTSATIFIKKISPLQYGQFSCIRYYETDDMGIPFEFPVKNERFKKACSKDFGSIPGSPIAYWVSKNIVNIFDNNAFLKESLKPKQGTSTGDDEKYVRFWFETSKSSLGMGFKNLNSALNSGKNYFPLDKGGDFRRWYGNNGKVIRFNLKAYNELSKIGNHLPSKDKYFTKGLTWSKITSYKISVRYDPDGHIFSSVGLKGFPNSDQHLMILGYMNSILVEKFTKIISPTLSIISGDIEKLPFKIVNSENHEDCIRELLSYSKADWDLREKSWDFIRSPLLNDYTIAPIKSKIDNNLVSLMWPSNLYSSKLFEESYAEFTKYWKNIFDLFHNNEVKNNNFFIKLYNLQNDLTDEVNYKDISILSGEIELPTANKAELSFNKKEIISQFISYSVGCMFGRYSLNKEGLILANAGETFEDYLKLVPEPSFTPSESNVIPVLENDWFKDDIVEQFKSFLKASFGSENFEENLKFIEDAIGKDIKKFFNKDFFKYHVKMYKKRPIYWMFSSPKGAFKALIYMHRYNSDTVSVILNKYLREYLEKIDGVKHDLQRIIDDASSSPKDVSTATKELDKLLKDEKEIKDYEDNVLFPMAQKRIEIDLDEGVLVNYNKLGKALEKVIGLNDPKTDKKVSGFDWVKR